MYHSAPSLVCNLHADCDLSTLKEWGEEEGLRSEDAANTAISPQLSSTNFLPFQLHQLVQHAEMTESSHMAPFQAIHMRTSFIYLCLRRIVCLFFAYECEKRERKGERQIYRDRQRGYGASERNICTFYMTR